MLKEFVNLTLLKNFQMREKVIKAIEDDHTYHFKHLWLNSNDNDERVLLELFCFGNMEDIPIGLKLNDLMIKKLQKLTIISLCEVNRKLEFNIIKKKCLIDQKDDDQVELLLMKLNQIIDIRIDSIAQCVYINRCLDCRDVHSGEDLMFVNTKRTKDTIIKRLQSWKYKLENDI